MVPVGVRLCVGVCLWGVGGVRERVCVQFGSQEGGRLTFRGKSGNDVIVCSPL